MKIEVTQFGLTYESSAKDLGVEVTLTTRNVETHSRMQQFSERDLEILKTYLADAARSILYRIALETKPVR